MTKRILVPLDGSQLSEAALPWAERVAKALDAQVIVFRAAEAHALAGVSQADSEVRALEVAQEYLNGVVARLKAKGITAWPITAYGKPGDHIAEAAGGHEATMIIMSTHGRSGLTRWLFGSVADKVVRSATVPVLLVRGAVTPAEQIRRVLVPLDGSTLAEQALVPADELAKALGLELVLLQVVMPRLTAIGGETVAYTGTLLEEDKESAWQYLDLMAKALRKGGVVVRTEVETGGQGETAGAYGGKVGEIITDYARKNGIDLIAMCSHCRSGLSRLLLGSVASDVLHGASGPVVLLNPRHANGSVIGAAAGEANHA
jgi:nucleotide-binding universal stress UspA family protein